MGYGNRDNFVKRGGNRGGGGNRGFRGGHGGNSRGGGYGGNSRGGGYDQGPPSEVVEVGCFTHLCENDIICDTTCGKIPYFNAPVYFKNMTQIGKIDEIFGGIKSNGFSIKLSDGIKASSFKDEQKIFIDPGKLLPIERFTNPQSSRGRGGPAKRGRSGGSGFRDNGNNNFKRGGRSFNNDRGQNRNRGRGGGGGGFKRPFDGGNRNFNSGPSKKFRQN